MTEPFIGEIKMVGFNFAPKDYAFCNGLTIPTNQNHSLFSLIGTTFGGDGISNFKLPDMRSRTPVHRGNQGDYSYEKGQKGGVESVTLTPSELPTHTHVFYGTSEDGNNLAGHGKAFAVSMDGTGSVPAPFYHAPSSLATMNSETCTPVGGGLPHENRQPFQAVNFVIALQGTYPPRN